MLHTKKIVQDLYNAGESLAFTFFYGHRPSSTGELTVSCFSQWWLQSFTVDGVVYSCAEQYMMAGKARLFGDTEIEAEIMKAKDQGTMKKLGRRVRNFDAQVWEDNCMAIVRRGNIAKFSQSEELKQFLLSTEDTILVEAAPRDTEWGIGLDKYSQDAKNPNLWRGKNKLGFVLMDVRDYLLSGK